MQGIMMKPRFAQDQEAFSLVELSIVIAIIGLVIGTILTGMSLAESSRISKTVAEMEAHKSSYVQFQAKYNALPGDFMNASRFFPGTNNGNGDGQIDGWYNEGVQAWLHLERAKLVPSGGYSGSYDWTLLVPGRDVPTVAYDSSGGYSFAYEKAEPWNNNFGIHGNTLHVGRPLAGHTAKSPIFSPRAAYGIDIKLDDGSPTSGILRAWDTSWNPQCTTGVAPNIVYDRSTGDIACSLLLAMD